VCIYCFSVCVICFNPLLGSGKKMCDVKTNVLCCQLTAPQTKQYEFQNRSSYKWTFRPLTMRSLCLLERLDTSHPVTQPKSQKNGTSTYSALRIAAPYLGGSQIGRQYKDTHCRETNLVAGCEI